MDLLISTDETESRAAEEALVAHGAGAVAVVETGLYNAEAPGRRRVIRVLVRIGDPAALPILEHLARFDPDRSVREAARRGAARLRRHAGPARAGP